MVNKALTGVFVVVLIIALTLSGCGSSKTNQAAPSAPQPGAGYTPEAPAYQDKSRGENTGSGGIGNVQQQRLIQNADLSYEVSDMDAALAELKSLIKLAGGLVADSSVSGNKGDNRYANLTLRIPEAKFELFIEDVNKIGKRISERKYINDVTMQYIDLEARIRNLEHQEERLLSILDKAQTVEDILRVEQELGRIRGQLETMTAEFRYLRDRVEFSTVQIYLRETPTASPVITGSGLKGVWQRGTAGLVNSVNSMLTGLGGLIVLGLTAVPYLALLFLLLLVVLLVKRRGKNTQV